MRPQRRRSFWVVLVGTTVFLTIDPGLFLVVTALALSGIALVWTLMLGRALLEEAFTAEQADHAPQSACPLRTWRGDGASVSSSARRTSSGPGALS
jgi:hypothetical protein